VVLRDHDPRTKGRFYVDRNFKKIHAPRFFKICMEGSCARLHVTLARHLVRYGGPYLACLCTTAVGMYYSFEVFWVCEGTDCIALDSASASEDMIIGIHTSIVLLYLSHM
jgi:hypothetical protein